MNIVYILSSKSARISIPPSPNMCMSVSLFMATKSILLLCYICRWITHQVGEAITSGERREHDQGLIEEWRTLPTTGSKGELSNFSWQLYQIKPVTCKNVFLVAVMSFTELGPQLLKLPMWTTCWAKCFRRIHWNATSRQRHRGGSNDNPTVYIIYALS